MSRGLVDASVLAPPRLCECGCGEQVKRGANRFASHACSGRVMKGVTHLRGVSGAAPATKDALLPGLAGILDHLRWTNWGLAKRFGVHQSAVTYWFRGRGGPTLLNLLRLCRLLHCTPNELTGHDPLTPERLAAIAAAVEAK